MLIYLSIIFGVVISVICMIFIEPIARSLRRKSLVITTVLSVVLTVGAELLSLPLAKIFVGYDKELLELSARGFMIYSISFLFMGFNIFASSFFTALNDGLTSAVISFLRTFLFQVGAILLLPAILKTDGIWLSITAAEIISLIVSSLCFVINKRKYNY